jgi:hypothetical protein
LTTETDQNNTFCVYTYEIRLYALPGSGAGSVVLLDASDQPVDAPFVIPQTCPPSAQDPCGPFIRSYSKKSLASLTPVQVVKYRTVSANGQSKVVNLPAPIEVY